MANNNVVSADLNGGWSCVTAPLWQWDYGQVLEITGIDDLPSSFVAHCANRWDGSSQTVLGSNGRISIPNDLLTSGEPVYVWIVLTADGTDGETKYKITIPVNRRAAPTDYPTTAQQSAITQAINALNTAAANAAAEVAAELVDPTLAVSGKAADAAKTGEELSNLKSDLTISNFANEGNAIDPTRIYSQKNSAMVANGDGTYTLGTTDYGNTIFDKQITLGRGLYALYGVPNGIAFVSKTANYLSDDLIVSNTSDTPLVFRITEEVNCYVGFRIESQPETSFVIGPYLFMTYAESLDKTIEELRNSVITAETGFNIESCDDAPINAIGFISSSGGVLSVPDFPLGSPGWLQTVAAGSTRIKYQIAYPYDTDDAIKYRVCQFDVWGDWRSVGGETITITQEVSRDTYQNTYNITTAPTITTDSNGWLQPVDTDTLDETGKTDMTGAIMSMLNSTGYCHLAAGVYYVSGNIDMPADSMIEGCGKKTIIRLLQSTTSGYIVRMHTRSTLKNVCLSGGYSPGDISSGNIGGRNGIQYIGNRDGQDTGVTPATTTCCMIDNCWFENLDSGFFGYNAGGGLQEGVICNNCYFTRCKVGINIDYWTEYCKFTNCIMYQCYYACINNGGNNVFTACTFHGVIGFLVDNSSGAKNNIAHGTVNGCTFNHIDNINNDDIGGRGLGVKILNIQTGFVFANCQFWYGRIRVENSKGVQVTGCEFGGIGDANHPVFETYGNDPIFIDNCLFYATPNNSFSSPVKISNCWTYSGVAVHV